MNNGTIINIGEDSGFSNKDKISRIVGEIEDIKFGLHLTSHGMDDLLLSEDDVKDLDSEDPEDRL